MKNLDLSEYKKLFSLVLGVNIKDIYKLGSNPNLKVTEMPYSINGCGELETINIFELSNMCNIWVIKCSCSLRFNFKTLSLFLI